MHQNSNMLARSYIQSNDNKRKHYIIGSHMKPQSSREEMESHNYALAAWLLTGVHNNRGGYYYELLLLRTIYVPMHIAFRLKLINEILIILNDPVNISMHVAS